MTVLVPLPVHCPMLLLLQLSGADLDGQPLATPDDCLLAEAIARDDAQVQQMVAARGVSFSSVACDPWAIHACPDEWMGRRLMQVWCGGQRHSKCLVPPYCLYPVWRVLCQVALW